MADTTLRLRYPTGKTLYTQIENGPSVYNKDTPAFESYLVANWAHYAVLTPETPASSGRYVAQFPTGSPAGNYSWTTYLQAGGSPASTDVPVGSGGGYWDGTTFGGASSLTSGVAVASLPNPVPLGYGPVGTGSRTVNHDYPTAGNLAFKTSGGQGIGGAMVLAYLAAEYATNPNTATIRGQTLTLDSGAWANVMNLDPGDYTLVYKAEGYETTVVNLTVS